MKKILYIIEYLFVYILYLIIKIIGIDAASKMGGVIARFISRFTQATQIARKNLKFVFPQLPDAEIDKIITNMWDNIGRTMAEIPHVNKLSEEEFNSRVQIVTTPDIKKIPKDKATICISGHFGNWETAAHTTLRYSDKISIVYRDANNPLVNQMYLSWKDKRFNNIPKGNKGIKEIIESIKKKNFICFLPDQKLNQGLSVDFFGKPAMTPSAPMKLALKFDLPILFGYSVRTTGANFKVYLEGPYSVTQLLKDKKNIKDKELELTKIMNKKIEDWIKKDPSQWFWVHRRWSKEFYK
ncbi:MAG: lysophospholipid acyltransferase family protein [Alphaproteobacteria bacterium]|nr:lysophospholipid acyltransferase family protein [Alphaproteobacteria bacterium]